MENMKARDQVNLEKQNSAINVIDMLRYLFFNWRWYMLSVIIFGSYFYYQYSKSPFVYRSSEMVVIKTPLNTPATARITATNAAVNSISVTSEIVQLKSKELMRETVSRVGAETSYSVRKGLRDIELYKHSPIQLKLANASPSTQFEVIVTPIDGKSVELTFNGKGAENKKQMVTLNKEVNSPLGRLTVVPTSYYQEQAFGQDITVRRQDRDAMVSHFLNNLKVTQLEDDASVLQVVIGDSNPDRAADLIAEMVSVYNEISLKDKNQIGVNTANFINERLAIIQNELGSVESNIEQLRESNQGVNVETAGEMYLSDSRQFQLDRTKVETDRKLAQMMQQYLHNGKKQEELIPNNTGLVDASVEGQIEEYNRTLLRKNRLMEGSSMANPVVQDMNTVLDAMRTNIGRAVDNAVAGLDIKIQNAKKEENLARGKALQIPQKQRMMLSVERQQKVKEELYLYLLNKREENALNQAMTEDNMRVIDPASVSAEPIYPSKFRKVATGVSIGLVAPTLILLLTLMFNTGVQQRQDIEAVLSVPFLGEIPTSRGRSSQQSAILVDKTGRDPLTEAFRILRTNINFMSHAGKPAKVITFTSFGTSMGKTFSAINLAAILSFLDKRVAVVDLDLRKGTLSARMGLSNTRGVSHFLSDSSVSLDDIIHRKPELHNLDCFPIGLIAPNPVELLLGDRLDQLVNQLKERYDYVVVDGVPMVIVADASIVDRISDLTLFMIRAGKLDRRQLPEIEKLHQERKLTNMAVVLNGLDLGKGRYGYGTYGYGGYGYGYEEKSSLWKCWQKRIQRFIPS
ncbi:polysaccharide biosynthesis tyrosine autokinase [Olivibacter sp. CPCC 100613]|uniref:GumC family protein n=1 Tax=Olivibacter sp. CPCC 100613 TaxID=3079931 RepID=UPI002FF71440